jgi:hypothetical protein
MNASVRARKASGIVVVGAVALAGVAMGSACGATPTKPAESPSEETSSSAASATKPLDCKFVQSPENCWKVFASNVSACLGGRLHATGKLGADGTTCTMEDAVMVKLGQPCDPDASCDVSEVFMGREDKKCMEFRSTVTKPPNEMGRGAGSFEIVSSQGTLKLDYDETKKTLTCPDGTIYEGSGDWKKELKDCADSNGFESIPLYAFTKTPGDVKTKKKGSIAFELSSMDVLFDCAKP